MLKPLYLFKFLRHTCRQTKKNIYISNIYIPQLSARYQSYRLRTCLSPVPSLSASRNRNPFTPLLLKIRFIHTFCYSYVKSLVYLSINSSLQDVFLAPCNKHTHAHLHATELRQWTEAVIIQRRSHRRRTPQCAVCSTRRRSASRLSKC